jgi:hypothetical protein
MARRDVARGGGARGKPDEFDLATQGVEPDLSLPDSRFRAASQRRSSTRPSSCRRPLTI